MEKIEKLSKEDILKNSFRCGIFKAIQENPGITYCQLMKTLSISYGSLSWHLKVLCFKEMIKYKRIQNNKRFYLFDYKDAEIDLTPKQEKVLEIIRIYKNATQAEIVQQSRYSQPTVSRILKKLLELGKIIVLYPDNFKYGAKYFLR